jgi:hypothetical protein
LEEVHEEDSNIIEQSPKVDSFKKINYKSLVSTAIKDIYLK